MKAVNDPTLIALVESMEVQRNIAEEKKREQEIYKRGVEAMQAAYGKEMM